MKKLVFIFFVALFPVNVSASMFDNCVSGDAGVLLPMFVDEFSGEVACAVAVPIGFTSGMILGLPFYPFIYIEMLSTGTAYVSGGPALAVSTTLSIVTTVVVGTPVYLVEEGYGFISNLFEGDG